MNFFRKLKSLFRKRKQPSETVESETSYTSKYEAEDEEIYYELTSIGSDETTPSDAYVLNIPEDDHEIYQLRTQKPQNNRGGSARSKSSGGEIILEFDSVEQFENADIIEIVNYSTGSGTAEETYTEVETDTENEELSVRMHQPGEPRKSILKSSIYNETQTSNSLQDLPRGQSGVRFAGVDTIDVPDVQQKDGQEVMRRTVSSVDIRQEKAIRKAAAVRRSVSLEEVKISGSNAGQEEEEDPVPGESSRSESVEDSEISEDKKYIKEEDPEIAVKNIESSDRDVEKPVGSLKIIEDAVKEEEPESGVRNIESVDIDDNREDDLKIIVFGEDYEMVGIDTSTEDMFEMGDFTDAKKSKRPRRPQPLQRTQRNIKRKSLSSVSTDFKALKSASMVVSESMLRRRSRTQSTGSMMMSHEQLTKQRIDVAKRWNMNLAKTSEEYMAGILANEEFVDSDEDMELENEAWKRARRAKMTKGTQLQTTTAREKMLTSWMNQARGSSLVSSSQLSVESLGGVYTMSLKHIDDMSDYFIPDIDFGRTLSRTSSMIGEMATMPDMADVTMSDDYQCVTKVRNHMCQVRPTTITVPVNLQGVETEYRDTMRGDLIRMHQNELVRRSKFSIVYDDSGYEMQTFSQLLLEAIKKMLRYGPREKTEELQTYEFLAMLFFYEVNVKRQMLDFNVLIEAGAMFGITSKILEVLVVDAPLMMFVLTMSSYSRFKFLRLFSAMPLLKGMGYCMFVMYIIIESKRSIMLELSARFSMFVMFVRNDWQKCELAPDKKYCIPFPTNVTHNSYCPSMHTEWNGTEYLASQGLVWHMENGIKWSGVSFETVLTYLVLILIWLMIFIMSLGGFYRSRKIVITLQVFFAIPILGTCVYIILKEIHPNIEYNWAPLWKFKDLQFTFTILGYSLKFQRLPFLSWVSTMKPKNLDPEITTLIVMSMKMFWELLVGLAYQASIFATITKNKINADCFVINALEVVYALMPDFVLGWHFATLAIFFWMMILTFYLCIKCVYVLQMIIDTICQVMPFFRRYPLILSTTLCALCMFSIRLQSFEGSATFLSYIDLERFNNCHVVTFSLFVLGLKFAYTWERFNDDYMFVYGRYPWNCWGIWLTTTSYVSFILFCLVIWADFYVYGAQDVPAIVCTAIVLVITAALFIQRVCQFIYLGKFHKSIQPDPKWIPYDPAIAKYRRLYFSHRDIKQKHRTLVCKHACLRTSVLYNVLVTRQKQYQREIDPSTRTSTTKRASSVQHKGVVFKGVSVDDDDADSNENIKSVQTE